LANTHQEATARQQQTRLLNEKTLNNRNRTRELKDVDAENYLGFQPFTRFKKRPSDAATG
jgi:hypothetical protein